MPENKTKYSDKDKRDVRIWCADSITALREKRGISRGQLADMVGVHEISMRRYETGDVYPPLHILCNIVRVLNTKDPLTIDEFKAILVVNYELPKSEK